MSRALVLGLLLALACAWAAGPYTNWQPAAHWVATEDDGQEFNADRYTPLPSPPALKAGPFSVTAWLKATELKGGNPVYGRGVARSNRNDQVGDWVLSVQPDGRVRFCNWRVPGDDKTGCHVSRNPVIRLGVWHHVVGVFDGTSTRVLVDGVEVPCNRASTASGWGVGHEVGRGWTQPDYLWAGLIDDVRVYRWALEPEQARRMTKTPPRPLTVTVETGPAGDPKVTAALDGLMRAATRRRGLEPAGLADDAAFHRRAMLDLAGRIPTRAESEAFLADRSADKRVKLIDTLMGSPEFPTYWSKVLSGWLMPKESRRDPVFTGYLKTGLSRNKRWDRITREILTASNGAAASFLGHRLPSLKDQSIARDVGEALFGVNLRCAQCHDHPEVKEWTRERFYGLSAFFARTQPVPPNAPRTLVFTDAPAGEAEYTEKGAKKVIRPTFLDGRTAEDAGRREGLVRLAVDPRSPYLKRALVNRVWHRLMGRGLVEPLDMIHDGNPATHPEVVNLLADDFAGNGFDLRRLLGVILKSEAYARTSRWAGEGPAPEEGTYALGSLRPLDADQLAASVALATETAGPAAEMLVEFDGGYEPTATQALFLLNADAVQKRLQGGLARALMSLPDDAIATRAYLTVLSRRPTPAEEARVRSYLARRGPKARAEACREVVWALLSGPEFRFNH